MNQRKTQTAEYWQKQFKVNSQDIEAVYQTIIEQNRPLSLAEIGILIVKRHCDADEIASRSDLKDGTIYQPKDSFSVDESVIFPALDYIAGKVVAVRDGGHPDYGTFTVIGVDFGDGVPREFVAGLAEDHPLNTGGHTLASAEGTLLPEELFSQYNVPVNKKLITALDSTEDLVAVQDEYFLRAGLMEFHEGLYNIADAAIDINQGPLSTNALIEQIGIDAGKEISEVTRFSVNYYLANDERFVDVGPSGQIMWYLERIEPPEVNHPPRRLHLGNANYDPAAFDEDLYVLLEEIDDESIRDEDTAPVADPTEKSVTIVVNYPHWRVGTLPLTPKTRSFFPSSTYNPVLFRFVDGRTGKSFPGWTVARHNYVFGLDAWYQKNKLPVGAYIILKRTDDPMKVIIDYEATRTQRDWVRMAKIVGKKLTFQMNPAALACKYDELMIIGDATPEETDKLWVAAEQKETSLLQLLCDVFPELSKLNPQSTVHAKTLYSAVNVIKRVSPGVVFQELASHRCFIPINHGYWTYDPSLRD